MQVRYKVHGGENEGQMTLVMDLFIKCQNCTSLLLSSALESFDKVHL